MEEIELTRYNWDWDCYSIKEYKWEDNLMIEKLEGLIAFHKKQISYWEDEILTIKSKPLWHKHSETTAHNDE